MKLYTIGARFTPDFKKVLLIEKKKPEWQAGRLNFPGGKIEGKELPCSCIAREFQEETGLTVGPTDWTHIGQIDSAHENGYRVEFLASVYYESLHGLVTQPTDEIPIWVNCDELPKNVISNLKWLVPFAINVYQQGNVDRLSFGHFLYY